MADRPIWRGNLRLALVSCPIALYSVRKPGESLHFHFINPDTGHRVRMVTQDAETDAELSRRDLRRGYEFEKDKYLLLEEEDFERARIDSSSVLNIGKFVPMQSIDPIYYDSSYYLVPDGAARDRQDDVYMVLREAIGVTGKVALSRLVMSRRERAVAILPMRGGLVLHTLHDMREIADPAELFGELPDTRPDKEMVALATQLIQRQSERFDPADMEDRYETRLRAVIDAKLQGLDPDPDPEPAEESNVVDLMAALRRSLGEEAPAARRTAAKGKKQASEPAGAPAAKAKTVAKGRTAARGGKAATPAEAAPAPTPTPTPTKASSPKAGAKAAPGKAAPARTPARRRSA